MQGLTSQVAEQRWLVSGHVVLWNITRRLQNWLVNLLDFPSRGMKGESGERPRLRVSKAPQIKFATQMLRDKFNAVTGYGRE
jgi:hypothetical protein